MTRDWHATYLSDPDVMAAAQARAMRTGEDGYAVAAELAKTLPPRWGSHDAAGARAVIAPGTQPVDTPAELEVDPVRGDVLTAVPDPAQLPLPTHPTYAADAPRNEIGLWQVGMEGPGYSDTELEARWASGHVVLVDELWELMYGPRSGRWRSLDR